MNEAWYEFSYCVQEKRGKGENRNITAFTTARRHTSHATPRSRNAAAGTSSFSIKNTSFTSTPIVSASKSSGCMLTPSHSSCNNLLVLQLRLGGRPQRRLGHVHEFGPGSLVSGILGDSSGPTTRRVFVFQRKLRLRPPESVWVD